MQVWNARAQNEILNVTQNYTLVPHNIMRKVKSVQTNKHQTFYTCITAELEALVFMSTNSMLAFMHGQHYSVYEQEHAVL